ncbi:MAG: hypothetical protein AMXMBFR53_33520 [Gemmatimonadota bacterium]
MPTRPVLAATAAVVLGAASPLAAQHARLGTVDFPNSGAPAAQADFTRGVLLLHSFEFEDAALAFRRAQDVDPDFALAYWGEAMSYNHPLWQQQDGEAARAALARYAPTPEARARKAPTERERGYLEAVDVLYGSGSKARRDRAYMDAMAALAARHPDDMEARAFHALAILGSTDGVRDFATYMKAAAVAQPVFDANPDHPGAAHYLIHSFDDPVHAPLGLPAARAYSEIAPGAAHAQHMTSHIFVALGLWDDVVAANVRARDVQDARLAELGRPANACGHYTSWLHYGWLMRGDRRDADRGMDACLERARAGGAPSEEAYYATMRARHVLDTRDWAQADRLDATVAAEGTARLMVDFVTAYAALERGDRGTAAALLAAHQEALARSGDAQPRLRIQVLELRALTALKDGRGDEAVALLGEACALEEALPFEFGPPASLKPPHEMLGEALLALDRHSDAAYAFEASLARTPGRVPSLEGLARAKQDGPR